MIWLPRNTFFNLTRKKLDPYLQKMVTVKGVSTVQDKIRVIIQFTSKPSVNIMNNVHKHLKLKRSLNVNKLHIINAITTKINRQGVLRLCQCDFVKKIMIDRKKSMHLNDATPSVGANLAQEKGWCGKHIGIAILDTGVYLHPDLIKPRNRIIAFKDYVKHKKKPYDDNGHGTHCAGDAAGNGYASNGKYKSPAPQANIIAVKVLDKKGNGYDSHIIRGIQWCIKNKKKYGIRIISLSLGGKAELSYHQDPVCFALKKAWDKGIVIVTSAGNEGPKSKTIDSPGICPDVITVGASNDLNQNNAKTNKLARYSSRGPTLDGIQKPDLLAPGSNIISLRSPKSYLDQRHRTKRVGKWYTEMSGTSMSTPIVAGIIAQILQKQPDLTPDNIKQLIKKNSISLGLSPVAQGSGLVNVSFLT